jgi:SAM-dependent methyltransferase
VFGFSNGLIKKSGFGRMQFNHPIIDLEAWLEQPAGAYIRAWEQAQLDILTADIFGFNALQIGLPQISTLAASRMPHKWVSTDTLLAKPVGAPAVQVVHEFTELPFATQSIDLVVLPHVLEFASEPHQILREVDRVLIPEGRLIICGFNNASLWGARQLFGRLSNQPYLPEEGEFISLMRLKDWLKLLSMEVNPAVFGCYAPPLRTEQWLQRFSFMEKAGRRWWPYFGAVYILQAVKRVRGMHLIGPALKAKRVPRGNAVPVTNANANTHLIK